MLIPMKVSALTVDPFTNMPIVVLRDCDGRRSLPIWIGLGEASAIATELENVHLARPMTHDLMKNLLAGCQCKVQRVEVHDLKKDTFFATIHLERQDGTAFHLDARPSDAIAIALRTGAAIMVAQKVLDKARKLDLRTADGSGSMPASTGGDDDIERACQEVPPELLETLGEHAFGKWKM